MSSNFRINHSPLEYSRRKRKKRIRIRIQIKTNIKQREKQSWKTREEGMEGNSLINGTKTCFLEWGQVELMTYKIVFNQDRDYKQSNYFHLLMR